MVSVSVKTPKPPPSAAEKSDFASRVRIARKALGISQQALSDKARIPISTLKNYELGHSSPSCENLQKMHAAGINPMWVLLGHRPILNKKLGVSKARSAAVQAAVKTIASRPKVKPLAKARISTRPKSSAVAQRTLSDPESTALKKESNDA